MTNTTLHPKHVCRELPEEILVSNVLPRLPMASLCRFQAVCKKWNALLIQRDFVAQHTLVSPAEEFVLIHLRSMKPSNCLGGWNFFDMASNKVFPLSHNFLETLAWSGHMKKILASDGGLLVRWYGNMQDHFIVVCNPILKLVKVIPSLQDRGDCDYDLKVMSTDRVSIEYEIVVFQPMEVHYQANYMDVFESKTGKWRRVVITSLRSPGWWFRLSRLVKFKNALYQLSVSGNDKNPHLIKFDKTTGVGSKLYIVEIIMDDMDYRPIFF